MHQSGATQMANALSDPWERGLAIPLIPHSRVEFADALPIIGYQTGSPARDTSGSRGRA